MFSVIRGKKQVDRGKQQEQVDRNRSDLKVVDEPVVAQSEWPVGSGRDAGRQAADISSNRFLCFSLFRLRSATIFYLRTLQ